LDDLLNAIRYVASSYNITSIIDKKPGADDTIYLACTKTGWQAHS